MSVLRFEDVTYRYPHASEPALRGVSLEVAPGEFVVAAGLSASGKSTFLRAACGLVPHFHGGEFAGRVVTGGLDTREHGPAALSAVAGTLFQDPETQVVLSTVRAELALPLENRGHGASAVARGVEETALALGIGELLERATHELSGGELQRVALGAALAGRPRLVLLDEPTSQLDPVAGDELVWLLRRLNEEWGTTIVLVEHRLERCLGAADRVLAFEGGTLACDASPRGFLEWAAERAPALATPGARLFARAGLRPPPSGVKEARATLRAHGLLAEEGATPYGALSPRGRGGVEAADGLASRGSRGVEAAGALLPRAGGAAQEAEAFPPPGEPAAKPRRGLLRRGTGRARRPRSRFAASGSSARAAARSCAASTSRSRRASGWRSWGETAPASRPCCATPTACSSRRAGRSSGPAPSRCSCRTRTTTSSPTASATRSTRRALEDAGLTALAGRHPRDLSGGERQRLALAIVCAGAAPPAALCLDEPTRGMDRAAKGDLAADLRAAAARGSAVLVATHDPEFAATCADRVVLLAGGRPIADGPAAELLSGGWYFATETARIVDGALLPEDGADILRARMTTTVRP